MRVSNNSKSFCSFSAVNTKYLNEAKKTISYYGMYHQVF